MISVRRLAQWLYNEFGVASVYSTGPDTWLVILARTCRMFAFGAISLIIALFMSSLDFSDFRIGLFMTMTLAGDVVISLLVALVADRVGRRRILFAGGLLMVLSGAVFAVFENYWVLLVAAVVGVVSATGGDFGPFRSVEESTLSHLTTPKTRSDVLSWYVTTSSLGSAVGTEISGRVVEFLRGLEGQTATGVYHSMFWVYIAMGTTNMVLTLLMSDRCEAAESPSTGTKVTEPLLGAERQDASDYEGDDRGVDTSLMAPGPDTPSEESRSSPKPSGHENRSLLRRLWGASRLAQISPESRSVVYQLWVLLTIDSFADGMVSYALTNYYLARKFGLSESYLGDIMSTSYLLSSISTVFAGPLARRLGLVNTMVFTHIPSSAAVLLFPLPRSVGLTIALLFVRTGLNNMDQAPRAAFIAAVVRPEERTAVMGITGMLRTLASTVGPSLTGFLAGSDRFWIAFVVAGALRIGYDVGLFCLFVGLKLDANEPTDERGGSPRRPDEEVLSGRAAAAASD